eukprot:1175987-Prorocentrum_minimum.AAC.2
MPSVATLAGFSHLPSAIALQNMPLDDFDKKVRSRLEPALLKLSNTIAPLPLEMLSGPFLGVVDSIERLRLAAAAGTNGAEELVVGVIRGQLIKAMQGPGCAADVGPAGGHFSFGGAPFGRDAPAPLAAAQGRRARLGAAGPGEGGDRLPVEGGGVRPRGARQGGDGAGGGGAGGTDRGVHQLEELAAGKGRHQRADVHRRRQAAGGGERAHFRHQAHGCDPFCIINKSSFQFKTNRVS